ncbi:hypothetical protein MKW98_006976, partial [Papaver atlanticum]
ALILWNLEDELLRLHMPDSQDLRRTTFLPSHQQKVIFHGRGGAVGSSYLQYL